MLFRSGFRALAGTAVSFAGNGVTGNALGGPGGGDMDGGLMYVGGVLVPIPPVTGNVILSATGAFVPGTSGVTLVPGTNYPTTTLTIDGNSSNGSAPASLTINTATVTLTGTNTYTGGTIVNNGVLNTSAANLPANQSITLNTSTLNVNQPTDASFGGVISGTGSVAKLGAGALTITGASTYTGGTTVSAGTLVASTTALPANKNVTVAPVAFLAFNQTADGTFGGAITGGGRIQKRGTGSLTLSTTTTSPIDIQAGSLYSNNGLGATTISAGAFLGGNATITGNLVNNGTVSPGNSPGTINVTGNYTQSSTGTLIIEIASGVSFDHLIVTGTAALAGTLQVNVLGGFNPLGQSFTFLTAAAGVTGTFGTINGTITTSAATAATVNYAPTSATIAFTQLPFAGFATTPNQAAVGNGGQGSPTITIALDTVPNANQLDRKSTRLNSSHG